MKREGLYGIVAEFESVEALHRAATALLIHGYRRVRIYAPYSVREVSGLFASPIGKLKTLAIAPLVFLGGFGGGSLALLVQEYANLVSYPQNIGGRPLNSWPSFIPITFETTILGAALGAAAAFLILNALPQFHHPLFNASRFERATQDRFFICVEKSDRNFNRAATAKLLLENATAVEEVQW